MGWEQGDAASTSGHWDISPLCLHFPLFWFLLLEIKSHGHAGLQVLCLTNLLQSHPVCKQELLMGRNQIWHCAAFPVRPNSRNQCYLTGLKAGWLAALVLGPVRRDKQISLGVRAPLCEAEAVGAQSALRSPPVLLNRAKCKPGFSDSARDVLYTLYV